MPNLNHGELWEQSLRLKVRRLFPRITIAKSRGYLQILDKREAKRKAKITSIDWKEENTKEMIDEVYSYLNLRKPMKEFHEKDLNVLQERLGEAKAAKWIELANEGRIEEALLEILSDLTIHTSDVNQKQHDTIVQFGEHLRSLNSHVLALSSLIDSFQRRLDRLEENQ